MEKARSDPKLIARMKEQNIWQEEAWQRLEDGNRARDRRIDRIRRGRTLGAGGGVNSVCLFGVPACIQEVPPPRWGKNKVQGEGTLDWERWRER